MEIEINDEKKTVMIWLKKDEANDVTLRLRLQPLYRVYKAKKYLVAVLESGYADLYETTRDLLLYNRNSCAEKEVQREKGKRARAAGGR